MIVLALDSTTPGGSVALGLPDGSVDTRPGEASSSWSERLPSQLLSLLRAHALGPCEVDLFAVAAGPGSLTGLRVGIATIQGLAFASGRPVVAVSALDALAECGWLTAQRLSLPYAMIGAWANALRSEVFAALYAPTPLTGPAAEPLRPVTGPSVGTPEAVARSWREEAPSSLLVAVGDLDGQLGDPLRTAFGTQLVEVSRPLLAEVLVPLARRRAARGEATPPHAVHPVYVRKPDAVLARERAGARTIDRAPTDSAPR